MLRNPNRSEKGEKKITTPKTDLILNPHLRGNIMKQPSKETCLIYYNTMACTKIIKIICEMRDIIV